MSSFNPLTGLIGLSVLVSSAFASPTPVVHRRAGAIAWRSCSSEFNTTNPGAVCGNLDVPLDYTGKESREMLQLDLIKIPATKGVSRGSILFNPGGPGYPGNEWLDGSAAVLLALVNFFFFFFFLVNFSLYFISVNLVLCCQGLNRVTSCQCTWLSS